MELQLLLAVCSQPSLVFPLVLLLVGAFAIIPGRLSKRPLSKVPMWGERLGAKTKRDALLKESKSIYIQSYQKFKDSLGFRVTTTEDSGEKLVVSPKYLEELKKLPASVLSFEEAHNESFEQRYTNSPPPNFFRITPHIIKANLTPALARLNPKMSAEAGQSVLKEIGDCNDWTPTNIYEKMLRIIAVVSGRVFIGPELCHDERYLDAAVNYTSELSKALQDIKSVNFWLKPFLANNLKSVADLRRREDDFLAFLTPVVKARRTAAAQGDKPPDDMLTWLMEKAAKDGIDGIRDIALIQLGLFFVAFHTTGITATNIFHDLASRPECIQPLRDEIRKTLDDNNGILTQPALQHLKKLDSFMKESLRFHPLTFATFERRVLRPFTLSDGQYIPSGTILEIPNHAISRDPDVFPDPETFSPWRFAEMRKDSAEDARSQFVSVSQLLGSFGYGRHACPGRFFAATELKLILSRALLAYDIRMKDGEEGRYQNLEFGLTCAPDPTREILFKRVSARDL